MEKSVKELEVFAFGAMVIYCLYFYKLWEGADALISLVHVDSPSQQGCFLGKVLMSGSCSVFQSGSLPLSMLKFEI